MLRPRVAAGLLGLLGLPLGALVLGGGVLVPSGCLSETNAGYDPPADELHFVAGMSLDPRVVSSGEACGDGDGDGDGDGECSNPNESCVGGVCRRPARWMFVTNANSDLGYNASALLAVDLDLFNETIADPDRIGPPSAELSAEQPCRRLAAKPQVIECHEKYFIEADATVHMGHFASVVGTWDATPGDDRATLLVPVRGDPSITWLELSGGLGDGPLDMECGQGSDSGLRDPRHCSDDHRLTYLRNDESLSRLGAEPINMLVNSERALAYVTHAADIDLTLLSLEGLEGGKREPIIVDRAVMRPSTGVFPGNFGIAERPCDPDAPPNSTLDCSRPLIYAAFRYQRSIISATVIEIEESELSEGQSCVGPSDLGKPGGIICDPRYNPEYSFFAGGISPGEGAGTAQIGDMAFSADGNELFAVQTNPGGLMRIDTSLDLSGNPRDTPAGTVEVCQRATAMEIYRDGQDDYALVSCYRSAAVFVVDLNTLTVVGNIEPGTGPHHITADLAREVVYVANTLEETISVVDMSRGSDSRFTEIARIGLQNPYSND